MTSLLHRFAGDRRANAATEFAFILPVMLILIAGIVEFGRWFQAYDGVNRLATRYASAYADCNDNPLGTTPSPQACNTELGLYWPTAALRNIAPQLSSGTVTVRMFQVQYSPTGTSSIVYQYPSSVAMSAAESQSAQAAILVSGAAETGVVVTIQYTYTALFFSTVFQAMAPGRNGSVISYTGAQRKT